MKVDRRKVSKYIIAAAIYIVICILGRQYRNYELDMEVWPKFYASMYWFGGEKYWERTKGMESDEVCKEYGINRHTKDFTVFYGEEVIPFIEILEKEGFSGLLIWSEKHTQEILNIIKEEEELSEEDKEDCMRLITGGYPVSKADGEEFIDAISSIEAACNEKSISHELHKEFEYAVNAGYEFWKDVRDFRNSIEQYGEESIRGASAEATFTYIDKEEKGKPVSITIDENKHIFQMLQGDADERGMIYCEETDFLGIPDMVNMLKIEGEWYQYNQIGEKNKKNYNTVKDNTIISENNHYKNLGEKILDGKKMNLIEVSGGSHSYESEFPQINTREQMLSQNGWTEEYVAAVEGFSENLNQYLELLREMSSYNKCLVEETPTYYYWVDASARQLYAGRTVVERTIDIENKKDSSVLNEGRQEIISTFIHNARAVEIIKKKVKEGKEIAEAKKELLEEQKDGTTSYEGPENIEALAFYEPIRYTIDIKYQSEDECKKIEIYDFTKAKGLLSFEEFKEKPGIDDSYFYAKIIP